jgi:hypothetical protein
MDEEWSSTAKTTASEEWYSTAKTTAAEAESASACQCTFRLKMDFKGQTAVLSAIFVLVGMTFLVPAITGKALGVIHATVSGQCGPEGQTHPCEFTLLSKHLDVCGHVSRATKNVIRTTCGNWTSEPSKSGTLVTWSTGGGFGDEKGSVTYKVGDETAVLSFDNPLIGFNKCSVSGIGGSCTAGKGYNADFTYNLRGR